MSDLVKCVIPAASCADISQWCFKHMKGEYVFAIRVIADDDWIPVVSVSDADDLARLRQSYDIVVESDS